MNGEGNRFHLDSFIPQHVAVLFYHHHTESSDFSSTMLPCNRAPVEIWQSIFMILAQTETVPEFDESRNGFWGRKPQTSSSGTPLILPRTPSLLSQVCSQWREYAYGMPDLWTTLFVKTPRYTSEHNPSQYTGLSELVTRRLTLARSMTLTIGLDAKDDTEFATLIIPTLLPFSRQWATVHVYAPSLSFDYLNSLHASEVPRLVSLKTVSHMYVPGTMAPSKVTCIPLMDRVSTITRLCTSFLPSTASSVYDSLEELHMQLLRSETTSLLLVLASCPRLRVLTLSGFGLTVSLLGGPPPSRSLLTMATLEVLNLEHPVGRESLLDSLVLPNLKSLLLCGKCSGESSHSVLDSINRLKERSSIRSLERLSISLEMHSLEPTTLIDFLCVNTSLKFLWVDDTYKFMNQPLVTSCLFDALTEPRSKTSAESFLCPQLETLRLTGCSNFEDAKLLAFLKSRCRLQCQKRNEDSRQTRTNPTITRMYMSVKRKVDKEVLETVRRWQEMGYSINLDSRS